MNNPGDGHNSMISRLSIQNFKCFENLPLPFKTLTLLSGLNSTGKSTVIQSLLLLRQSFQHGLLEKAGLALNGDLVHIGTAKDALFENAKEDVISFDLSLKDGSRKKWSFNYSKASTTADLLELTETVDQSNIYKSSLFNNKFHYLQAERLGPRRFFETSDFLVNQQQIGSSGEYAAHFLSIFGRKNKIASGPLCHPNATSLELKDQVEAWLGEISPGTRIDFASSSVTDTVSLQFSFATSNKYRATNVGFGITYVLPVLVAILSSEPGFLILIENPEAHLHPKGQAQMGELLARAASSGIQIVVETHSDHVLNGIRIAAYEGRLDSDKVQLHFFQKRLRDGQNQVISPQMDRDARIYPWPDGFFDEWDKSLEALLEMFQEEHTFRCPGGEYRLFSWHARLTPGAWRIYFYPEETTRQVIIGHIGHKLANKSYRT